MLDAMIDQQQGHWVKYGMQQRFCWFSISELQTREKEVFSRLSGSGMNFLTTASRNSFKAEIEAHRAYRPAFVAAHPGWIGNHYVLGDGTVIAPHGDPLDVRIAFQTDSRFTPTGTLKRWQESVGQVVAGQSLPLFALGLAFVGPLLRFAPRHILNPQVELVGEPECGKSIVAILAASVFAGDLSSDIGGGETWDLTINSLDLQKQAHADSLLFLDEGNLAGASSQAERELMRKAIFKIATKGGKKRFTDTTATPNVNVALLSTSNVPLRELVKVDACVGDALSSRMITIQISKDAPHGVLTLVPEGFSNAREAMERLRTVIDQNYGVAGRTFIKRLVQEAASDRAGLCRRIGKLMDKFLKKLPEDRASGGGSARVEKTFGIIYAAGFLARKWHILPDAWGSSMKATLQVYRSIQGTRVDDSALNIIRAYVKRNRDHIISVSKMKPYSREKFDASVGFYRKVNGKLEVLFPSQNFQHAFPKYANLMQELKKSGHAKTESGKQKKMTIKTPLNICKSGRVYCINIY